MANTFDLATHLMPLPERATPGRVIAASDQRALTGCLNHLHALLRCGEPFVAQGWAVSQCARTGARANLAGWRIPTLSAAHTSVRCEVIAGASAGGGFVHFVSANTGAVLSLAIAAGAPTYYSGTLNVGSAGDYDDITMDLEGVGTVTVDDVQVFFEELSSPLAAGLVATPAGSPARFRPFGEAASGADRTLSAARGQHLVDDLGNLRGRRRVLFCWSGLEAANVTGPAAADASPYLGPWPQQQLVPLHPGAFAQGVEYEAWAWCERDATQDTRIYLHADDGERGNASGMRVGDTFPGSLVTVPLGVGSAWYDTECRLAEVRPFEEVDHALAFLGLWPQEWSGVAPAAPVGLTNARVKRLSVWGE